EYPNQIASFSLNSSASARLRTAIAMNAGANSPRVVAKDLPTTPKRHRLLRADHEASGSNPNALLVELPGHRHFQKVYQFTRRTRHYGTISVPIVAWPKYL